MENATSSFFSLPRYRPSLLWGMLLPLLLFCVTSAAAQDDCSDPYRVYKTEGVNRVCRGTIGIESVTPLGGGQYTYTFFIDVDFCGAGSSPKVQGAESIESPGGGTPWVSPNFSAGTGETNTFTFDGGLYADGAVITPRVKAIGGNFSDLAPACATPETATDNTTACSVSPTITIGEDPGECDLFGVLPVELTSFEATADGDAVVLRWNTASETNNAGFDVEYRPLKGAAKGSGDDLAAFERLGFVEGHGTTVQPRAYHFRALDLEPGRHVFRLRQVDYDGTFEYSPEVEVIVGLPDSYVIEPAYPNPFNPEATMRFAVQVAQQVEVSLYNTLGQRVRVLFTGEARPGAMEVVEIDGSGLPSGLYLVRVVGERFSETQTITLLK